MTEIWAVAHPKHKTRHVDTKQQALALVDAWTTERAAAICWPMTVEDCPHGYEAPINCGLCAGIDG